MDPNATLARIRELTGADVLDFDELVELSHLIEALDEWISKGGFLPSAWERSPVKPHEEV